MKYNIDINYNNEPKINIPKDWNTFFEELNVDNVKPNRLLEKMKNLNKNKLLEYSKIEIEPSKNIINKQKWVSNLYLPFSKLFQEEPYPLQPSTVAAFLKFCLLDCNYSINSVNDVIIPVLKFKEKEFNNSLKINPKIDETIKITLKNIKSNENYNPGGEGKEPCLIFDMFNIIKEMNIFSKNYEEEICLYLIAINCGARSVTMENILLEDILSFTKINEKEGTKINNYHTPLFVLLHF